MVYADAHTANTHVKTIKFRMIRQWESVPGYRRRRTRRVSSIEARETGRSLRSKQVSCIVSAFRDLLKR